MPARRDCHQKIAMKTANRANGATVFTQASYPLKLGT
jgi:uncharacterized protein YlaI